MITSYSVSTATIYDEDEQLWFTKVGTDGKNPKLCYTVWGATAEQSIHYARKLTELLTKQPIEFQ